MSDLEYLNKYLKYKAKYINLKNEIESQEGGVGKLMMRKASKLGSSVVNKTSSLALSAVKSTGNIASAVVNTSTDVWLGGYYLLIFSINNNKSFEENKDELINQIVASMKLNKNNNTAKYLYNFKDFKSKYSNNLWYIKNNSNILNKNIFTTEMTKNTTFNNACKLKSYDEFHIVSPQENNIKLESLYNLDDKYEVTDDKATPIIKKIIDNEIKTNKFNCVKIGYNESNILCPDSHILQHWYVLNVKIDSTNVNKNDMTILSAEHFLDNGTNIL